MANSKGKKSGRKSPKSNPVDNPPKSQDYEKSVIKQMEESRLRIKPWVLQLIGGAFILIGLIFIAYPFVSRRVDLPKLPDLSGIFNNNEDDNADEEDGDVSEENGEDNDSEAEDNDEDGDIANGASGERDSASTEISRSRAAATSARIASTGRWVATDYKEGDITKGDYEIKLGDTLWEISEAVYGDGSQWQTILANNSSQVGFLADGSQALIIPGQVLTIS